MKIIILITTILLVISLKNVFGNIDSISGSNINLATNSGKILFDITNIKPGDFVTRNMKIKNNGKHDFKYISSIKFVSGSEILFNKLNLIIRDHNEILYNGKLFEFRKLSPRILESKQSETLHFIIKVPMDLTNEFQGLETQFHIKFYVKGTLGGLLPADGFIKHNLFRLADDCQQKVSPYALKSTE